MTTTPELNDHNKLEYAPAHTAEHILNRTMVNMFGCPRSNNAHIEKKKSKCDYILEKEPSEDQIKAIEDKVNEIIKSKLDINMEYMSKEKASKIVDLNKLPKDASETLRIVSIGNYDYCACIGRHVKNTSEIGEFKIISSTFTKQEAKGKWRIRWKLI